MLIIWLHTLISSERGGMYHSCASESEVVSLRRFQNAAMVRARVNKQVHEV